MTESWKTVVPERDRLILERADFGGRQAWGRTPALLIVDVVRSFTGSKPQDVLEAINEYSTSCGTSAWETLPRMRQVLDAARAARIPVIYTKGDPDYRAACGGSVKNESGERSKKLHSTPIADEIAPIDGEFVIRKTKASAFFLTPLSIYLVRNGVDSLILMGTSTSGCVRATAVDGISHGYPTFVVSDGCFDRSQFFHDVTLYDLNTKYATIVTAAETIEHLKSFALKAAE
ncbi:MAG TPA: isochorismatase family protein [Stellaceae bacterium]|nr:isochorismatase family protein [Stellaceae bacterium]